MARALLSPPAMPRVKIQRLQAIDASQLTNVTGGIGSAGPGPLAAHRATVRYQPQRHETVHAPTLPTWGGAWSRLAQPK